MMVITLLVELGALVPLRIPNGLQQKAEDNDDQGEEGDDGDDGLNTITIRTVDNPNKPS